jgi:Asp-tRNA(Asn)/Glu-tRNA(Gln) amidotransferase A subunit family amidase
MELAALVKSKQITSLELTQFFLARLKKYDPILKVVITLTEERAIDRAHQADKEISAGNYRGPLHGIPYGVKDIIAVKGYKTTWGSEPYKDQVIEETATVVKKLDDAGAVLVAKLTSGALARGDVWFGGKTLSPWDTTQGSSGSSAGSASATAAGLVPFALGTETWGSIISPSTRCGVTGLRPTYGRVSRSGVMALSWSMDKVGPICRSAADCAVVFETIRGVDKADPMTTEASFNHNWHIPVQELKVGYLNETFEKDTTNSGENGRAALEIFKEMGVELKPVKLPDDFPFRTFDIILRAEAGTFFDELLLSNRDDLMIEQTKRSRVNSLRQSRFIPAVEYIQANRHRSRLIESMQKLMKDYDVVISPQRGGNQTLITNLTGHPAISVPAGFDEKGRPTSIILVGNLYDEASILALAKKFQDATDFEDARPPIFSGNSIE